MELVIKLNMAVIKENDVPALAQEGSRILVAQEKMRLMDDVFFSGCGQYSEFPSEL